MGPEIDVGNRDRGIGLSCPGIDRRPLSRSIRKQSSADELFDTRLANRPVEIHMIHERLIRIDDQQCFPGDREDAFEPGDGDGTSGSSVCGSIPAVSIILMTSRDRMSSRNSIAFSRYTSLRNATLSADSRPGASRTTLVESGLEYSFGLFWPSIHDACPPISHMPLQHFQHLSGVPPHRESAAHLTPKKCC